MNLRTFEVKTKSGRTIGMKELDGLDQVNADMLVPEEARSDTSVYFRVVYAIQSIDGEPCPRLNSRMEMSERMRRLTGRELDELVREYFTETRPSVTDLKNELPPAEG